MHRWLPHILVFPMTPWLRILLSSEQSFQTHSIQIFFCVRLLSNLPHCELQSILPILCPWFVYHYIWPCIVFKASIVMSDATSATHYIFVTQLIARNSSNFQTDIQNHACSCFKISSFKLMSILYWWFAPQFTEFKPNLLVSSPLSNCSRAYFNSLSF